MNLQIEILEAGSGPVPEAGQNVLVHYTGRLTDGTQFDSSLDRNEPFEFAVGVGQVIEGWDVALLRMRAGDKARITIPPAMAYGSQGVQGAIPPNATLIFEVQLLEVRG